MSQETAIDKGTFSELTKMVGEDFIGELIDTFCSETPQLIVELQRSLTQGDAIAFRRTAHSIKSSSASLGALQLSSYARDLEMLGKEDRLNEAAEGFEQLTQEYQRVATAFKELGYGA